MTAICALLTQQIRRCEAKANAIRVGHTLVNGPPVSIAMASFRLMHCRTGAVLNGYRVTSATEDEIARANHNLRGVGSEYRFVVDLHPPVRTAVCDQVEATHSGEALHALPA